MSAATTTGIRWPQAAPRLGRAPALVAAFLALLLLAAFLATAPLPRAAAGVLTAVVGLGLLIEPALGLIVLAAAIPWSDSVSLPVPLLGAADLLVGIVLVLWLARGVTRREIILRLPPLSWSLLLFVWVAGLSLTQAFSWRDGLPEWLKWVEFAVLYIVASQILGPRSTKWLIAALLAGGLSQVALGGYQFLHQVGPEAFALPGGFLRAHGSFGQPNPYSGYLGYLAPVAASLALFSAARWWRSRRKSDLLLALALVVVTGALAGGIVMSWSRGGLLGLIAAFAVVAALRSWRTAAIAAGLVAVMVVVVLLFGTPWLPSAITVRLQDLGGYASRSDPSQTEITDANFSVLERIAHWQAGLRMFDDRPWLGVGVGNYAANYAGYAQPHWYEPLGHAHNALINFAAEMGVLGLVTFLMFWTGVAYLAAKVGWARLGWISALGIGVLGTWTYLTIHGLFDNLFVQYMQLQLALLLAALVPSLHQAQWAQPPRLQPALSQPGRGHGSRSTLHIPRAG